jgi:hypothetical protein
MLERKKYRESGENKEKRSGKMDRKKRLKDIEHK